MKSFWKVVPRGFIVKKKNSLPSKIISVLLVRPKRLKPHKLLIPNYICLIKDGVQISEVIKRNLWMLLSFDEYFSKPILKT